MFMYCTFYDFYKISHIYTGVYTECTQHSYSKIVTLTSLFAASSVSRATGYRLGYSRVS